MKPHGTFWIASVIGFSLALVTWGQEDSIDAFRECEVSFEQAPEESDAADCFYEIASAQDSLGPGAQRLQELLKRYQGNPSLQLNLGLLEYLSGEGTALDRLRLSRDAFQQRGDFTAAGRAQRNIINTLDDWKRWREAWNELEIARAMPRSATDTVFDARLDLWEARLYLDEGRNLGQAFELLLELKNVEFPDAVTKKHFWNTLGSVAYELNRLEDARSAFRRSHELAVERGNKKDIASASYHLAMVELAGARDESDRENVIKDFRRALQAAEEAGRISTQLLAHLALGRLLPEEESRGHLEACLKLDPGDGRCLAAIAYLSATKKPTEAKLQLEEALSWAKAGNDPWAAVYLWPDRLPVVWSTRPREEAITEVLTALEDIERLRDQQNDGLSRAGFFSVWADVYRWVFGRLLEEGERVAGRPDLERAFEISERYRARSLMETLDNAGVSVSPPSRFLKLSEAGSLLAQDEALVIFQVAPWKDVYDRFGGGSWLLTIHRGGAHAYRLGEREEIERQVRFYLGLAGKTADSTSKPAARLYRDLVGAGLEELPPEIKKLIILPDGILHNLPWNTLRASPETPPLVERYELSLIASATLWQRWRQVAAAPPTAPALVLADPEPSQPVMAAGVSATRSSPALGPLPRAKREGKAVVRYLGGSSRLLTGLEASEHFLKTATLRDYGLLHIAAHAVVDDTLPQRSFVLLAPGSASEDGELHMADIVDLDLDGRVVVLAACSGASGQVLQGEGVMSLSRAFFQAGARAVVASLWPLEDRAAERLFDAFYREIAQGASLGQALKSAQEQRIRAGAAVSEWAGVVVLGDASAVPNPGGSLPPEPLWTSAPAIGAAVLLAVLALLAWSRFRSRPA